MTSFFLAAAGFVLAMMALGLLRIFRGPSEADRMMAVQLLGTGGVAVLLLLGAAAAMPAIVDVALLLALLAAFAGMSFVTMSFVVNARTAAGCGIRCDGTADESGARYLHRARGCGRGVFFMAGTIGLLRFPDSLTRLHALTKADNLGLGLMALGPVAAGRMAVRSVKMIGVWLFVQMSGAISRSRLIARDVAP